MNFLNAESRYANHNVLVTGGTSGIGLQIAKAFLAEGAKVIITSRSESHLKQTKDEIGNPNLYTLQWDVADVSIITEKLQKAHEMMGPIDIFVNNAGIYESPRWDQVTPESFDKVHQVNTRGLFFMCQAEGKYMIANSLKGNILNIVSVAGITSGFNPYSVSKWGAACITKGLAKILVSHGIVVNGIAPGIVVTNIHEGVRGKDVNDNAYTSAHLTKRYTLVEEISSMALYLCSGSARNIIGQIIAVDGGGWALS